MEKFDVRIVAKDIINNMPIATCVVTHNNLYFATVRYNYFNSICQAVNTIGTDKIYRTFHLHFLHEYDEIMNEMCVAVRETIKKIV